MKNRLEKLFIMCILGLILFTGCNDKTNDNVDGSTGTFVDNGNSYVLDIEGYENNSVVYYKLSDKVTIKLVFKVSDDNRDYDIYVNDQYLVTDWIYNSNEIKFSKVGTDLVYINTGVTDIASTSIYIINKDNKITEIYELDSIDGMTSRSETISSDSIIIEGSRITHMGITYGDIRFIDKDTILSDVELTGNEVVMATYTYKLKNGSLDLTPIVSNEITLNEYFASLEN